MVVLERACFLKLRLGCRCVGLLGVGLLGGATEGDDETDVEEDVEEKEETNGWYFSTSLHMAFPS